MKFLIACLFLALLQFACEPKVTYEPTEDEQQLMKAYAALLQHHDRFGKTVLPDSVALYRTQVDSLLGSFGFTREEFQSAFENLVGTPERFDPLMQTMINDFQQGPVRR